MAQTPPSPLTLPARRRTQSAGSTAPSVITTAPAAAAATTRPRRRDTPRATARWINASTSSVLWLPNIGTRTKGAASAPKIEPTVLAAAIAPAWAPSLRAAGSAATASGNDAPNSAVTGKNRITIAWSMTSWKTGKLAGAEQVGRPRHDVTAEPEQGHLDREGDGGGELDPGQCAPRITEAFGKGAHGKAPDREPDQVDAEQDGEGVDPRPEGEDQDPDPHDFRCQRGKTHRGDEHEMAAGTLPRGLGLRHGDCHR